MVFRGGFAMVKGIAKRVVVVKSPDPRIFDEAIFIVKEDASKKSGVTNQEILRQAQGIAENYIRSQKVRRHWPRLSPAVYAIFGACATGLAWVLTAFML